MSLLEERLDREAQALERRAEGILLADRRTVRQVIRVDLHPTSSPQWILFLNERGDARTAWIWHRPDLRKPTIRCEQGFAAWPRASCVPDWAVLTD